MTFPPLLLSVLSLSCALPEDRARPMPALPEGPAMIEDPDDRGAWLLPIDGGPGVMVYRWQLPADARDGDVIVGGQVDRALTERHHRELAETLRRISESDQAAAGDR